MNYEQAMVTLRNSTGLAEDVVAAISWGIAVGVNDREPDDGAIDIAKAVWSALNEAGFRVVKL